MLFLSLGQCFLADLAKRVNVSVWVSYIGHGSVHGWDGPDFGIKLVKQTANNDALPIVFSSGCLTGRFRNRSTVRSCEYLDEAEIRHNFAPAAGADPDNPLLPAMVDRVSGQTWGYKCPGCNRAPLIAPKPSPYDFDRGDLNFAYPWLIGYPQGGAIAYLAKSESWKARPGPREAPRHRHHGDREPGEHRARSPAAPAPPPICHPAPPRTNPSPSGQSVSRQSAGAAKDLRSCPEFGPIGGLTLGPGPSASPTATSSATFIDQTAAAQSGD